MKKYINKKGTKIGRIRQLKKTVERLKTERSKIIEENAQNPWQMNKESRARDLQTLDEKITKYEKEIKNLTNQVIRNTVAIVGAVGMVTGVGRDVYTDINNDRQDEVLESSYSMMEKDYQKDAQGNPNNEKYNQFEYYLRRYFELANKESRSPEEDKQMEAYRTLINSSPEELSNYTLKLLKKEIAEVLGIDEYSRITIHNNSTEMSPDVYHPTANGFQENVSICLDGDTIAQRKVFTNNSDGEKHIEEDSMPMELVKVIEDITAAEQPKERIKALREVIELKQETILYLTEYGSEIPEDLEQTILYSTEYESDKPDEPETPEDLEH